MTGFDWVVLAVISIATALILWLVVGVKYMEAGVRKVLGKYKDSE